MRHNKLIYNGICPDLTLPPESQDKILENLEGQSKGYLPILVKRGKNPIFQGVRAFLVFNLKKNADYQSLSIVINSYQSLSIWCYQRCYQIDVKKRDGNTTAFKKSLEMQNFKNIKK